MNPHFLPLVGVDLNDSRIETPAFVIDDLKLEKNLAFAKKKAENLGIMLRPHLKTHKSCKIALRQMMSPEGPAAVSTLAEADMFFAHGVKDMIYAVGIAPQKLPHVARLRAAGCDLKIILDNPESARLVSEFSKKEGVDIPVLIEVDVDGHRSGAAPESATLIATAAALKDGAKLVGVLTHAGESYSSKNRADMKRFAELERDGIVEAANRLRAAGCKIDIVSLGSTPTLKGAEDETGVTEIRAGVYALMDLFMANLGACGIEDIAGSVLTTVIGHQPAKGRVITDSGFLAVSRDRSTERQKTDYAYGLVCGVNGTQLKAADGSDVLLTAMNQEHGILTSRSGALLTPDEFPVGTRLRILPNHACPTAAPYSVMLLLDGENRVKDVLPHMRGWDYCPSAGPELEESIL